MELGATLGHAGLRRGRERYSTSVRYVDSISATVSGLSRDHRSITVYIGPFFLKFIVPFIKKWNFNLKRC
jgi:hypothetical protein